MKKITTVLAGLGLLLAGGAALAADGPDACTQFAWNVSHELALFGGPSAPAAAGRDPASAPAIETGKLYALTLVPQSGVTFAHAPSKKALNDGAYAGLARVHVSEAGVYRVAIDGAFWVDVLSDGKVLSSGDFTGNHACRTLSKLVEFELPSGEVLLQLSGAGKADVHVALTRAPARKS